MTVFGRQKLQIAALPGVPQPYDNSGHKRVKTFQPYVPIWNNVRQYTYVYVMVKIASSSSYSFIVG